MDSIDLFESPYLEMQNEAARRKRILALLFCVWAVLMGSMFCGAYVLKKSQEKRIDTIQSQLKDIEPRMAYYRELTSKNQYQKSSHCAAYRMKALLNSPLKGLHLSKIEVIDTWQINGYVEHPSVLDLYKDHIAQHFDTSEWTENFENGTLGFHLQGKILC